MSEVLYIKHRPTRLEDLVGQPGAVAQLQALLADRGRFPHCVLLTGPSGTGKTTCARIIKDALGCSEHDFREYGDADSRGIDTVRQIQKSARLVPMSGGVRVFLLDEFHLMTGEAQNSLLLLFENTPRLSYFLLCTTNPAKVIPTIRSRATEVRLSALPTSAIKKLVKRVAKAEGIQIADAVLDRLAELADGGARKALVLLHQIAGVVGDQARMEALEKGDSARAAFDLVKALLWEKPSWANVQEILRGIDDDPEGVRRLVLSLAGKEMLKAGVKAGQAARAAAIISCFRDNFFDCGQAGLILACWEVFRDK